MKFTMMKEVQVEAETLLCQMGVRSWEDGLVNGQEDKNNDPQMPFAMCDKWCIEIDLESGKILDWPEGVLASIHYKVCDDGYYALLDASGDELVSKHGYVPAMLSPDGEGCGDYAIMTIGLDGKIENWLADLRYFGDAQ